MDRARTRQPQPDSPGTQVGDLLRQWRAARRMSQLDVALDAGVSTRHLSYVETGKAQPSRDMVQRLADFFDVPLRERNRLLVAAGYAPHYPETSLDTPELTQVRRALDFILEHQEPYPAFVLNRRWDVLRTNAAAGRVVQFLRGGTAHANVLRQFFDPDDLRGVVVNWSEIARDLIRHVHEAVLDMPSDARLRGLLEEILRYPGVPTEWRTRELGVVPSPLLTVVFRKDGQELRFFSTIATFGTPQDVTLDEIRIECTFPADEATAELCAALARDAAAVPPA
jgi:transcriptional regulator with XRE-family HTH domain